MPNCSKCGNNTQGHPKPWGPQCKWDGKPEIPSTDQAGPRDKAHGDKAGGSGEGGDKVSQESAGSGRSEASGSTSPLASLNGSPPPSEVEPRLEGDRDTEIDELQKKLKLANEHILLQKRALEEKKKDDTIKALQKQLAELQLQIQKNDQVLNHGSEVPTAAPVPSVDPSLAAYAGAVAQATPPPPPSVQPQQQQQAPVAALAPVFQAMQSSSAVCGCHTAATPPAPASAPAHVPAPTAPKLAAPSPASVYTNHDGTPQGILASNPLTKALLDAAQAASPTEAAAGKQKYLPHKYVLKPGLREPKSVDQLSFSEFMHAYLRMLEAMCEAQEPVADRLDFIIRLVSEATHKKWFEVRALYILFETEVINGKMSWLDKFEGQIEKMAYNLANKSYSNDGGNSGHNGGNKGKFKIVACKDWNWKDNCAYSDENCKYEHVCFKCLSKGSVSKEHKAKECASGGAAHRLGTGGPPARI